MVEQGGVRDDFFSSEIVGEATPIGTLPGGKHQVAVKNVKNSSMYEVIYAEGGKPPAGMEGSFTTYEKAEKAARVYLGKKWADAEITD